MKKINNNSNDRRILRTYLRLKFVAKVFLIRFEKIFFSTKRLRETNDEIVGS